MANMNSEGENPFAEPTAQLNKPLNNGNGFRLIAISWLSIVTAIHCGLFYVLFNSPDRIFCLFLLPNIAILICWIKDVVCRKFTTRYGSYALYSQVAITIAILLFEGVYVYRVLIVSSLLFIAFAITKIICWKGARVTSKCLSN